MLFFAFSRAKRSTKGKSFVHSNKSSWKCKILKAQTYFEMLIYGAGGHAKVIYDCLNSQGIELKAVFDDNTKLKSFLKLNIVTPYTESLFAEDDMIIGIGSNKIRNSLANSVNHSFGNAIHKTALMAQSTMMGEGSVVLMRSVIQTDSKLGNHVIINTGAIVEHDCVIEDFVHIGPGAVICGHVKIGAGAFVGANATILPGLSIGQWASVGAGAVVLNDVHDGVKVAGNPAIII